MAVEGNDATLAEIRRRLDTVDSALVDVLVERSQLIGNVVRYKRAHSVAVVDRHREDEMLENIEEVAEARGLDRRIARQVLRSIIDAFTILEVEELGPDEV